MNPPTKSCFWVKPKLLLAGDYPGAADPVEHCAKINALRDAGVRVFISLMEVSETNHDGAAFVPFDDMVKLKQTDAQCLRFPIKDLFVPTRSQMVSILDAIDAFHENGKCVYLHCWGGVGRTGTVVGCWLLRKTLATQGNVLDVLKQLRRADAERGYRDSPETEVQRMFVALWNESTNK